MNGYFVLDVLEIGLLKLPPGKISVFVNPHEMLEALKTINPFAYRRETVADVKKVLRAIFPAYKNPRARTKVFKVRHREAKKFIQENRIIMRPLEDARKSRRMSVCYESE
jgi:hypothetical protein